MDVLDPYGWAFDWHTFDSPDAEYIRIDPDLPKQQILGFPLGDNQQNVLRNDAEVFPPKEDKVVIPAVDLVTIALPCGADFLVQNRAHYLFSTLVTARLGDLVRLYIRRGKTDLRRHLGDRLLAIGTEDLIFPGYLIGLRLSRILLLHMLY